MTQSKEIEKKTKVKLRGFVSTPSSLPPLSDTCTAVSIIFWKGREGGGCTLSLHFTSLAHSLTRSSSKQSWGQGERESERERENSKRQNGKRRRVVPT